MKIILMMLLYIILHHLVDVMKYYIFECYSVWEQYMNTYTCSYKQYILLLLYAVNFQKLVFLK